MCGDGSQATFPGWEGSPEEALAAASWEGNGDEWALAEVPYPGYSWYPTDSDAAGFSGWEMPWDQKPSGGYPSDAPAWAEADTAWNEGQACVDTKQDVYESPEKTLNNKKVQKKAAHGKEMPDKEDRINVVHKGGGEVRHPELSSTATTVMLRNIPNKFMPDALAAQLNNEYKGMFDFMYLPIDFKNKCNVGYGFVNFRTPELCSKFVHSFNGVEVRKCLPGFNSRKVVEVTPARVQGLHENVKRLRNSPVMSQLQDNPEWLPLLFDEDGSFMEFPEPDQPLAPVRPRGGRHKDVQK